MKHQWTMLLVGFILTVLPFLGFPYAFDYSVMFLAGLFFFIRALLALKHHYGNEADAHIAQSRAITQETQIPEQQPSETSDTQSTTGF